MQPDREAELTLEGEHYRWGSLFDLPAGETAQTAFYVSLNLERDGARTGALHLRRMGWERLLDENARLVGSA